MDRTVPTWRSLIPDSRRFWENVFLTPLHWLFLYFFQPVRFSEQFEYRTIAKRFTLMVRLAVPLFLLIFLVAFPVQGLLLSITASTSLPIFTWNTLPEILLPTLLGITCGLLVGVLDNVGLGIILSIALGVTGIVMGDADRGVARGIAIAIVFGLVTGTAKGLSWGIWRGIPASIFGGLAWIIATIAVTSITESITRGTVVAGVFFVCYMIGYYRVPLYLVSGPSGLRAAIASKRNPADVFLNLHKSSLYWDECVFLPLPLLRRMLLIAVGQNVGQALQEIAFIVKQRPQQIHAAQMAAIEIALRDLQGRETIRDIATASQRLSEIFPQEVMLKRSGSMTPFTHLIAVSLETERYTGPFNWQTKRAALETMRLTLNKIYPDTAFPDARLNTLLGFDHTVRVWNASTGQTLLTYGYHLSSVNSVCWSPRGTKLASGSDDKTVQVWNASSGKTLLTYLGHTDNVVSVVWSPNGGSVASASQDGTVQIW